MWQILSMSFTDFFPAWLRLIVSIFSVIITGFNFNGNFLGRCIFAIMYNAIWMLSELLTGCFFLLFGISIENYGMEGSILSKILLFMFVKALQCFFKHKAVSGLSWKENAKLMILPVGSMFIAHHMFTMSNKIGEVEEIWTSLFSFSAILVINIIMFKIYIKLSESYELKHKNSIFKLELDLYYEHMQEKEYVMKEFRKSKHDLKHQLVYLLQLTENREYEQLEDYLKKLIDLKPLQEILIANTENSLIDALVNYKYSVAKRYGITFAVKLEVPTSLPFDSSDLCVILGNAIDNAIEANLRGEIQNPYIELKIKFDGDNLIISLANSFDGKIITNHQGKIVTRKQEKEKHGIGLVSIQNIIEKYHGYYNTEIEDNIYKTRIILYSLHENG